MTIKKQWFSTGLFVIAAFVLAACTMTGPVGPGSSGPIKDSFDAAVFDPDVSLGTETFSSVAELEAFLQEAGSDQYYGGWGRGVVAAGPETTMMNVGETAASPEKAGGDIDYSETNVQVVGVDEGDIIKTDGEYVYTTSGNTLFIVKAYPGEDAEVVEKMAFEKGAPQGLFINDDWLVVFGRVSDYDVFDELGITSGRSMTFVEVYDVRDKEEPELEKEFLFDGNYFDSRMIDGHVYLMTNSNPQYYPRPVPLLVEDGSVREIAVSSIRYYPYPYDSVSFVGINAIDLDGLEHESMTLAVEDSHELYMSHDNLYFAYTKYINDWDIMQEVTVEVVVPLLSASDQALVERVEEVDNDILNKREKQQKILTIISRYVEYLPGDEQDELQEEIELATKERLQEYDYAEYTIINKVAVDGLDIDVVADGMVPGSINNQFSLDEHEGVLRVATTVNPRRSSFMETNKESENFVFTLDEDFAVMDSLDDIAVGERIYASRFMGERLYLVTFRRVDPFFVIDLSDPEDVVELGELKIPGFSRYLHPYDDDIIIGLGRDASVTGRTQGLKISLFDVAEVSDPEEVAHWVSSEKYSSSTAEYEHKAFLFDKEKHLLVIPAYSYEWNDGRQEGYNGALVFDISADDIEVRGLVDHSQSAQSQWQAAVERSLYIEDLLYTKSYSLLRINA
ncbi:beta-propeller domain-containing protein, partial [Candidatus Woesearchaeota archaeon]|nr:beta-propeller domain-containing protein [Candidatus Woesearchaeota archaeon]